MDACTTRRMDACTTRLETPVGELVLTVDRHHVLGLGWKRDGAAPTRRDGPEARDFPLLAEAGKQLREYFAGTRKDFDLPLRPHGTAFQARVWEELRKIPFGETLSYRDLARHVGNPGAMRAVGSANGKNPICIFIPCHRVVRHSGELGGFAGGAGNKALLLDLERQSLAPKKRVAGMRAEKAAPHKQKPGPRKAPAVKAKTKRRVR